jgi:hypothetical protein
VHFQQKAQRFQLLYAVSALCWRIVQSTGAKQLRLTADASPLSEVLNVAWAAHEITSDMTAEMLDWFEHQLGHP